MLRIQELKFKLIKFARPDCSINTLLGTPSGGDNFTFTRGRYFCQWLERFLPGRAVSLDINWLNFNRIMSCEYYLLGNFSKKFTMIP